MKTAMDLVGAAKAQIQEIDTEGAEMQTKSADAIIDVREPDEFAAGHLPGAINIPRGLLEFKLSADEALSARDLNILLYCKTSGRAALAAQAMKEMGYLHVSSISGGFDAWLQAGKPVFTPSLPDFD
ncbi:rhodanese-like domain-containing protein [Marinobacterium lutimaris]|uniref:Rhodanese-related sulfurtransferase n=1 Tax=Marinobacterium lutimaris TaxID=568106 RepID=A0A1H5Z319_9GAMM|nr:rhodanese-like domain-containing protein [Marinobacterium lutimaris]SEG30989.1 Rhodanese-related sulfurtransferase [Marinobacterium lutimaris]